jgi:hypothetical protein
MFHDDEYRPNALFKAVTHKSSDWSHEREVRALQGNPGVLHPPPGLLTSIMIGQDASDDNVRWLCDLLKASDLEVELYRVH